MAPSGQAMLDRSGKSCMQMTSHFIRTSKLLPYKGTNMSYNSKVVVLFNPDPLTPPLALAPALCLLLGLSNKILTLCTSYV